MVRQCRFCGKPLPDGASSRRIFCSDACREQFKLQRRKRKRRVSSDWLQPDPWSVEQNLTEEEAAQLLAGIDPLPAEYEREADAIAGPLVKNSKKESKFQGQNLP